MIFLQNGSLKRSPIIMCEGAINSIEPRFKALLVRE